MTETTQDKKKSPLRSLISFAVVVFAAYQLYQWMFGAVPACDAKETQNSLLQIFQEQAQIPTDKITLDSLLQLQERGFADDVRTCQGDLKIGAWQAPFTYKLSWQSRLQHTFLTSIEGAPADHAHAWYLLSALPRCDNQSVHGVLESIYAQVSVEQNIPIQQIEAFEEVSFNPDSEVRVCKAVVIALENNGEQSHAPFRYQITWQDKTTSRFYTEVLEDNAQ